MIVLNVWQFKKKTSTNLISLLLFSKQTMYIFSCILCHLKLSTFEISSQGKNELKTSREIEEIITIARDQGRKLLVATEDKADFEYYCSLQNLDRLITFYSIFYT